MVFLFRLDGVSERDNQWLIFGLNQCVVFQMQINYYIEAESEESDERVIGRKTSEMEKNEARRVELCKR